jgi:hypothetical protein
MPKLVVTRIALLGSASMFVLQTNLVFNSQLARTLLVSKIIVR